LIDLKFIRFFQFFSILKTKFKINNN
jgi:hypothetical protein